MNRVRNEEIRRKVGVENIIIIIIIITLFNEGKTLYS